MQAFTVFYSRLLFWERSVAILITSIHGRMQLDAVGHNPGDTLVAVCTVAGCLGDMPFKFQICMDWCPQRLPLLWSNISSTLPLLTSKLPGWGRGFWTTHYIFHSHSLTIVWIIVKFSVICRSLGLCPPFFCHAPIVFLSPWHSSVTHPPARSDSLVYCLIYKVICGRKF